MMYDELKKIDEQAKRYKWSPNFTLEEKMKVVIEFYLKDYDDRELTRDDFIEMVSGKTADVVYPEDIE